MGARVRIASPACLNKNRKMKTPNTKNQSFQELILKLTKKSEEGSKLISRVAQDINRSRRIAREVNLSRINRYTKEGETIIVPGKVLGGGELDHKITISALKFSESALSKLKKNGSTIIPLNDIIKDPLTGKRVRIIG